MPAYIVFNDRTLTEMAQQRPVSRGQLLRISGVGEAKLARYGDEFITEILR